MISERFVPAAFERPTKSGPIRLEIQAFWQSENRQLSLRSWPLSDLSVVWWRNRRTFSNFRRPHYAERERAVWTQTAGCKRESNKIGRGLKTQYFQVQIAQITILAIADIYSLIRPICSTFFLIFQIYAHAQRALSGYCLFTEQWPVSNSTRNHKVSPLNCLANTFNLILPVSCWRVWFTFGIERAFPKTTFDWPLLGLIVKGRRWPLLDQSKSETVCRTCSF